MWLYGSLQHTTKRKVGSECLSTDTILYYLQMHAYKDSEKWVKSFSRIFDRNVKLYQSTEKCPNRALHNLVTLGGQAKAHFCRCTFLLISISTDLCNKKVPHFTLHFLIHFLRRAFFSKRMGSAHFCCGGRVVVTAFF